MSLNTQFAAAVAAICAPFFPAAAQDVTGTITGTLALEPATWYVTSAAGDDMSGWRWNGNEVEVRLVGQVRRDVATATEGTLTIVFRTQGNPTEMNVSDFSISLLPREPIQGDAVYTAGDANMDLDVEALVVSDDEMALGGSFSGQLILGGANQLILDEDVPNVTVDGNFQATIPRLSDRDEG